jgi:hypothetical protein
MANSRTIQGTTQFLLPRAPRQRFWRRRALLSSAVILILQLAGVVIGLHASSSSGPVPGVLISTTSSFAPETGDVYVKYLDGSDASAQVSGQVTNAAKGEVAGLYAQKFPFTRPATRIASVALGLSGTTGQYSFPVTPTLATRYTVKVFQHATAATPLATSAISTIYVVMNQPGEEVSDCVHSQCHSTETVTALVPASALSAQMSLPFYTYFAVNVARSLPVASPQWLRLGAGNPVVSSPRQISADEYQFSVSFSYQIKSKFYDAGWRHCTKSAEATDGVGLPGSHGCASQQILDATPYLG